jgi:hypothetical protein
MIVGHQLSCMCWMWLPLVRLPARIWPFDSFYNP